MVTPAQALISGLAVYAGIVIDEIYMECQGYPVMSASHIPQTHSLLSISPFITISGSYMYDQLLKHYG